MITTIIVLLIIAAVLLTIMVLIQNPKGGGISSEFGGSGGAQMFGVQKTGDIVERLTWGFFTFILVGSLGTLILLKSGGLETRTDSDVNVEKASPATSVPALPSTTPADSAK
ncbi:preprotein translocase subunit SecG [Leadbetterella byssophila]|jgi:preprotein translocase subunit SecG|uniref:Protein-export membrane protein SecG n=1 Tax=Leadbetterella byssophila (strain DSM 17132 / JCM 16389 / KACC 11308 / NBRC 106382 / 4M15) TaxID=649349 RepID=E4RTL0_LEAB4|nr:preprotein translocase subunit SecG [Leadbetterella byssophila]ADQ16867.1 preprotein translocase, SecG subunit [Leadbetterella byssophila DSM 17132]